MHPSHRFFCCFSPSACKASCSSSAPAPFQREQALRTSQAGANTVLPLRANSQPSFETLRVTPATLAPTSCSEVRLHRRLVVVDQIRTRCRSGFPNCPDCVPLLCYLMSSCRLLLLRLSRCFCAAPHTRPDFSVLAPCLPWLARMAWPTLPHRRSHAGDSVETLWIVVLSSAKGSSTDIRDPCYSSYGFVILLVFLFLLTLSSTQDAPSFSFCR